jgi:DNA primase catalytic core
VQVSKDGIERIKAANELLSLVAERGIEVKRKGRVAVARCPFHEEKTASFTITPSRGLYHCFGCGAAGDVIGFVTKYDKVGFATALERLARRAGLDLQKLMQDQPRTLASLPRTPLTRPVNGNGRHDDTPEPINRSALLARVVDHYHRTFCERKDAQEYLAGRGLTDPDLLRAVKAGYADGSLLKLLPKTGELRSQLVSLGVVTAEGRELLGGCVVIPIPDPLSGQWVSLYGRGVKADRHCYLPGSFRGVFNFQAARISEEVVLTESILDALSFQQAWISTAIPLYGTNGFTAEHLDTLKREGVKRVILALDGDDAGKKAAEALKGKLIEAGLAVRVATFPADLKDPNALLISRGVDALRQVLDDAEPKPAPSSPAVSPLSEKPTDGLTLSREGVTYTARVYPVILGRLRATVRATKGDAFHVDTLDLYASRSRTEYAKKASKVTGADVEHVEAALLALVVDAETAAARAEQTQDEKPDPVAAMTTAERDEALAFLRRPDLLDQAAADIDAHGYVGEEVAKRLLYLVAVSRKLSDPLSAIVLSQSGAGKSGITEVIERLTPPEDVVMLTRLTPQSLYYVEPGFLDRKLVIVEERYGSMEADYSIRVLQSRKKLIAAAPIKDPATGSLKTKVFTVEARAAFIEATTASSVNHENATRCFELGMDESEEQTRRIHERQRLARTEAGLRLKAEADAISRKHWNAQRLLEPAPVVIPYADKLTFPSAWMRTRRDHARFLNLIEVSAFLHQHQRQRSREGAIVASAADYQTAYALSAEVLKETLTDVKRPLREAYSRIAALCSTRGGTVSRREIREALCVPDSTARRWLQDLVDFEYIAVQGCDGDKSSGQGKTVRYRLLEREPEVGELGGLLSPTALAQVL